MRKMVIESTTDLGRINEELRAEIREHKRTGRKLLKAKAEAEKKKQQKEELEKAEALGLELAHGHQVVGHVEGMIAFVDDDGPRLERLVGKVGRAHLVTAAALGAGVHVEEVLPGKVLDLGDAVNLVIFVVILLS